MDGESRNFLCLEPQTTFRSLDVLGYCVVPEFSIISWIS